MALTTHKEVELARLRAIAVAALAAQLFTAYLIVLGIVAPASEANWARADPILLIAPRGVSQWIVPALGLAAAAVWVRVAAPRELEVRRAVRDALLGVVAAGALFAAVRLVSGPTMPSFVPAEENAGPGYLLSMTAGYAEEVLFRFALLPVLYLALTRRLTRPAAIALSAIITGLAFALLHDAGPGSFDASYFVTRVLGPGTAMSVVFLAISPTFVVIAHCTAHILIPALFVAG